MFTAKMSCGRVLLRREQEGSPTRKLDKSLVYGEDRLSAVLGEHHGQHYPKIAMWNLM